MEQTTEGPIDQERRDESSEVNQQPYFVEVDRNGCPKCGAGRMWTVIGPDGAAIGESWSAEEPAQDMADEKNDAYDAGMERGQKERDQLKAELEDSLTRLHWFFEQFRERRHHPYTGFCDCICCSTERLLRKHGKLGGKDG